MAYGPGRIISLNNHAAQSRPIPDPTPDVAAPCAIGRARPRALCVLHQETSTTGRIGMRLAARGYEVVPLRPACGDALPTSTRDFDAVVVFGGPMSANDDHLDFVRREIDWCGVPLRDGTPFLGVCLGAQLLARHLGARVYRRDDDLYEIGYHRVDPGVDPAFLDRPMHVFQWHQEGFDAPRGCEVMARGARFADQAFRVNPHTYAIQFHPELTRAMHQRWVVRGAHRLDNPGAQPPQVQLQERMVHDPAFVAWLERFLDLWLAAPASARGGLSAAAG